MKVVILTSGGQSASLVYNSLNKNGINVSAVVLDIQSTKRVLLKKRIKKFGFFKVLGQVIFQTIVVKALVLLYAKYLTRLKKSFGLNSEWRKIAIEVEGINSDQAIDEIKRLNPDIIVLAGTKILSKRFLSCFSCPIINIHVGITPKYRGVHGGYWALVNNDIENFGVTVHLVDSGIDTGNIIEQRRVKINTKDSFVSYGLKQSSVGAEVLADILVNFQQTKKIEIKPSQVSESKLYSHPTVIEYFYFLTMRGIK